MIISIELSDDDWRFVCVALESAATDAEAAMSQCIEDEDELEMCIDSVAAAERLEGYITTLVGNAMERARPKFSDN